MQTDLEGLFHHRWITPILAELHLGAGAKFVTLIRRLGIPRDSLQRTLAILIDKGWVMRNPGHGHPLRPEYILTSAGESLGARCFELMEELHTTSLTTVARKKWSMPVIAALNHGPLRFSELRALLEGVTPRALTLCLKQLVHAQVVARYVSQDYPPTTTYELSPKGKRLGRCLQRFC